MTMESVKDIMRKMRSEDKSFEVCMTENSSSKFSSIQAKDKSDLNSDNYETPNSSLE